MTPSEWMQAQWLEEFFISDTLVEEAYELTSDRQKSSLKKTIALLASLYGEFHLLNKVESTLGLGSTFIETDTPVPCCILFCDAYYSHAAAYLAALMMPVLARVPIILPVFYSDNGTLPSPEILSSLDLAGIEQAFACKPCAIKQFIISCEKEFRYVKGVVLRCNSNEFSENGNDFFITEIDLTTLETPEHIITKGQLSLGKNYEDIWIWPHMTPHFFRQRFVSIG